MSDARQITTERSKRSCAVALALLTLPSGAPAQTTAPLNNAGEVGKTNYTVLPSRARFFRVPGDRRQHYHPATCSGILARFSKMRPIWLLLSSGRPASPRQASCRQAAHSDTKIPMRSRNRATCLPASQAVSLRRIGRGRRHWHGFKAWVAWTEARPTLPIMAADGGSMPTYFRPWGGSWGHISPLMPLAAADCSSGMTKCSYGDWYAYRWGQTAGLSGAYGIMLSTFPTRSPANSRRLRGSTRDHRRFRGRREFDRPKRSTSQRATWIVSEAMSK